MRFHLISKVALPFIAVALLFAWCIYSYMGVGITQTITNLETVTSFGDNGIEELEQQVSLNTVVLPLVPLGNKQPVIINNVLSDNNIIEMIINSIGMFLYLGIAVIGILMMIRYPHLSKAWVMLCVGTLLLGFVPSLLGYFVLKERWWYLAEVFMSIPLAVALIGLVSISKKTLTLMTVAIMVGIVVFFSTVGLPANQTNRSLSQNQIVRYALTDNEIKGLGVANKWGYKCLGVDPVYSSWVLSDTKYVGRVISFESYILNGNFNECPADALLIRDAIYKEPLGWGNGSVYKLEYNPIELAKIQGYSEVWSNGEIKCLIKK